MAHTEEENTLIWLVQLICGSISVVCCLFICICYLLFSSLRGYEFRLIVYLTLSDMIASILYMIPPSDYYPMCSLQGAVLSLATNLRLAFSSVIAASIHFTHRGREDMFKQKERSFLFLIFIMSAIAAGLPYTTSSYGRVEGLCWITIMGDGYLSGTLWRFGLLYIPLWIAILYNSWVYYRVIKNIKKLRCSSAIDYSFADYAIRRLSLYPAILIIGWLPASIKRIIEIFHPEFQDLFLTCLSLGFLAGLGFFNAIAYGFTPEVRDALLQSCLRKEHKGCLSESGTATTESNSLIKNLY